MTYKEEFITFMVRSGVLTFGDFTTKSGRKTPYFVNTGNYKTGAQAAKLGDYYAACIQEHMPDGITCLFGPAYKGIPLAVSAAASLYRNYDRDLPYCFNRKEAKDHGEGGSMVGYKPQDGDDVAIVEDVVTAGTAVRESIELFKHVADVNIKALFVSVDRMERGTRECSTLDELRQDYGIQVFPIVTVREVIAFLHNNSDRRQGLYRRRDEGENGSLSGGVRGQGLSTAKEDREREGAGMAERRRSIHTGHRQRVKDEFLRPGTGGLAGPPGPGTAAVLRHPPGGCERAGPRAGGAVRLAGRGAGRRGGGAVPKVPGVGQHTAVLLKLIPAAGARYLQSRADLGDAGRAGPEDAYALLAPYFFGARQRDGLPAVRWTGRTRLWGCGRWRRAASDAADMNLRRIMEEAMPPSGRPRSIWPTTTSATWPSPPRRTWLPQLRPCGRALAAVGIELLDHLVFVDGDMVSMRDSGMMK